MSRLLTHVLLLVVNAILPTRPVLSAAEEIELSLARSRDPYFFAFRARCLQWVYGDDPRRALEEERASR